MNARIGWLDISRVLAIVMVVFTHSHEQAWINDTFTASLFYSIDRLGVPIFLMISGGLILERVKNMDIFTFYKKRIPQFIILLVVYSVATNVVMLYFSGEGFIASVIKSVIDYNGIWNTDEKLGVYGGARQMWYMYSIIQLYLVAPFVARLLGNLSNKQILLFVFFCVLFSQFKGTLSGYGYHSEFLNKLGWDLTGPYVSYFVLGYLIVTRRIFDNIPKATSILVSSIVLVSLTIILIKSDLAFNKLKPEFHWYSTSLFIMLSSIALFILLKNIFQNIEVECFKVISMCSFGVYLSHYAFIYIGKYYLSVLGLDLTSVQKTFIYFTFAFTASLGLSYVLMKNKLTKYFVC